MRRSRGFHSPRAKRASVGRVQSYGMPRNRPRRPRLTTMMLRPKRRQLPHVREPEARSAAAHPSISPGHRESGPVGYPALRSAPLVRVAAHPGRRLRYRCRTTGGPLPRGMPTHLLSPVQPRHKRRTPRALRNQLGSSGRPENGCPHRRHVETLTRPRRACHRLKLSGECHHSPSPRDLSGQSRLLSRYQSPRRASFRRGTGVATR
jgi:hypothetical protein